MAMATKWDVTTFNRGVWKQQSYIAPSFSRLDQLVDSTFPRGVYAEAHSKKGPPKSTY